ncbi:MAG: hypothetical protein LBL97_08875 [Prevotellaceae bacterium]|jgi:hypothetical protein|nr:hypothetical protein [Prevotellaceae bacterium]
MKKYLSKYMFLLATAILLFACEDENTPSLTHIDRDASKAPVTSLSNVSTMYGQDIYVTVSVNDTQGLDVMQSGAILSTDQTMLNVTQAAQRVVGEGALTFSGLNPQTTYYLCSYGINSEGVGYGEVQQIVTGKAWERVPIFKEDFTTTNFVSNFYAFQFGDSPRGWIATFLDGNFYDSAAQANPFGTAEYVFCSESYSVFGSEGYITGADNLLEFVADFTDGLRPQVTIAASSFGDAPLNTGSGYWDKYYLIASLDPITTVEEADAADVIASPTVSAATSAKNVTFDLPDKYAGQVAYIGIRHLYEEDGYMLMITYVDASALYEPID